MTKENTTLAIFGGAFDPPHVGHVLAVHYTLLVSPARRVLVIPCGQHPFGKRQAAFEHRLAMCELAFRHLGNTVQVLEIEGRRDGVSYTIDTLRELREQYPATRFEIVIGSDTLDDLDRWREIEELRRLADFRILPRLTEETKSIRPDKRAIFCLPPVSSTTVRELLETGGDASGRVPREVLEYIARHGLYRT